MSISLLNKYNLCLFGLKFISSLFLMQGEYTGWFYYYLRNCTAKNGMALKKRFNVCRVYLSFTLVILSKKEICTGTQKHKAGVLKQ